MSSSQAIPQDVRSKILEYVPCDADTCLHPDKANIRATACKNEECCNLNEFLQRMKIPVCLELENIHSYAIRHGYYNPRNPMPIERRLINPQVKNRLKDGFHGAFDFAFHNHKQIKHFYDTFSNSIIAIAPFLRNVTGIGAFVHHVLSYPRIDDPNEFMSDYSFGGRFDITGVKLETIPSMKDVMDEAFDNLSMELTIKSFDSDEDWQKKLKKALLFVQHFKKTIIKLRNECPKQKVSQEMYKYYFDV